MSGASALAAAKRRRAVPAETPIRSKTLTEVPRVQPSTIPVTNQTQTNQTSAQNPLQLLLQHEQKINELQSTFSKINLDKPNPLTPDSLEYFKTQHEHMNREINELKKILIKVQTFSMETNLELLKMKKQKGEPKVEPKVETKIEPIDSRFVYNPSIPELSSIEENSNEESVNERSNEFNLVHENIL